MPLNNLPNFREHVIAYVGKALNKRAVGVDDVVDFAHFLLLAEMPSSEQRERERIKLSMLTAFVYHSPQPQLSKFFKYLQNSAITNLISSYQGVLCLANSYAGLPEEILPRLNLNESDTKSELDKIHEFYRLHRDELIAQQENQNAWNEQFDKDVQEYTARISNNPNTKDYENLVLLIIQNTSNSKENFFQIVPLILEKLLENEPLDTKRLQTISTLLPEKQKEFIDKICSHCNIKKLGALQKKLQKCFNSMSSSHQSTPFGKGLKELTSCHIEEDTSFQFYLRCNQFLHVYETHPINNNIFKSVARLLRLFFNQATSSDIAIDFKKMKHGFFIRNLSEDPLQKHPTTSEQNPVHK